MRNREDIKRRLHALLSRTVENGATEAEALVAARKAADLMREHGLSYRTVEEIEAEQFTATARPWFQGRRHGQRRGRLPVTRYCLASIARLCSVDYFWTEHDGALTFFGTDAETATAHYFVEIIANAIERETKAFRLSAAKPPGVTGHKWLNSFRIAMAIRIAQRLDEMADDSTFAEGRGLVLLKDAKRREQFQATFTTRGARKRTIQIEAEAALAGLDAGGRVDLNRGVAGEAPKQIKWRDDG